MTLQRVHEIDRELLSHRCHYKVGNGAFHSAARRLEWAEVIELIPSLTLADLAAYKQYMDDAWQREIAQYACR